MDYESFRVDRLALDDELSDIGSVGGACAHQFEQYLHAPRALVWRNPSSDWRLFMVLLPLPERLTLIRNPIFAKLVRDWGMELRVIGVDHEQRVFDFRQLLTPEVLYQLLDALASSQTTQALDVVFSMLASQLLTIFEQRRQDWPTHLAKRHRLPGHAAHEDPLFDRSTRTRGLVREWQGALRQQVLSVEQYSRALRSVDTREAQLETRLTQLLLDVLHPGITARLRESVLGLHLGCYNWLLVDPRHVTQRAYVLSRLSCFAQVFADLYADPTVTQRSSLMQAIDSGQDRRIIDTVAQLFAVDTNTVRHLWRVSPSNLGTPSFWRLQQLLLYLDACAPREWPAADADWQALAERSFDA
jgi:hypothetical protein